MFCGDVDGIQIIVDKVYQLKIENKKTQTTEYSIKIP